METLIYARIHNLSVFLNHLWFSFRYLQRTAQHHVLRTDPDFREFLEQEGELPRATNTSALSGAGVLRLFHKVGDAVEKITFKMDETDEVSKISSFLCHFFPWLCGLKHIKVCIKLVNKVYLLIKGNFILSKRREIICVSSHFVSCNWDIQGSTEALICTQLCIISNIVVFM